ncbi:hypothetical protein Q0Z83_003400 [Actinoplanes sichuanensis]|uniref:Uncharacterized protein n=1 Tax=Actinoplanes sichuanensis TaxID=512349 RepID=A0ABW4AIA8_9ACTN|nr:hypothetical protein [Actinoplanes sichuanensis]BEL02149.1 hypothetical protein Q0Z83_003400 [Actinoplanes sichuanensis]
MTGAAHLPMREVVRRVGALPGVRPVRFVPLLLPMWAVDVVATVREAHPYDVFDRYLTRALAEAGLSGIDELAVFFGVEPVLVDRTARFLEDLGHVRRTADGLELTDLGRRSMAAGRRYRLSRGRRLTWLFDGAGEPVPFAHATHAVWLPTAELTLPDGTVFTALTGPDRFPPDAVGRLPARADVADFTGPAVPVEVVASDPRPVWLPVYLVECEDEPLVFGWAVDGPDPYLLRVYRGCVGELEPDVTQCGDRHGP